MIKKVVLKAPILTNSGYGVHSRQVFKALEKRKDIDLYVIPTNWGNTSWILSKRFDEGIVDKIVEYSKKSNANIDFDESYQVLLPSEWSNIAKKNIGITAGFEADIVKESWIQNCNKMDHVIVPSEFSRMSFVKTSNESNTKLKTKISVINEWYYEAFDHESDDADYFDSLEYDKNILVMGQITSNSEKSDRKNILKTIRVATSFISDKEIGLVLKISLGKNSKKHKEHVKEFIINNLNCDKKKITLIFGALSIKELKSLYSSNKISCLLSGNRAEGWGLNFVEAARCGLPIVATDYSAYKEYLCDDFLKVKYKLINFSHDLSFVDAGSNAKWAEFEEESMKENLDILFKDYEKYKRIALGRKNIIKQQHSIKPIIDKYNVFFKSIE